jgi:RsiW-degrading membrane proteinase PrsW (M82 family)
MSTVSIISLSIATLIPLIVLLFIRSRNLYQTGSFWMVLGSFVWGALVYALVAFINSQLLSMDLIGRQTLVQFFAPIEEEILKALLFVYLFRQINFTYFVDGAITGFAIGIGFAVFENYEYVLSFPDAALNIAVGRVISTNLIHACATAIAGIAFGLARFHKSFKRIAYILGGLLIGMVLHVIFNNLVTRVSSTLLLVYAAGVGILSTIIIYALIRRGLAQARIWIEEKLGASDRVTSGEAQLVGNLKDAKDLLVPLVEMFGKDEGDKIYEFLLIQARLGIHRKNLDKFEDPAMVKETQAEIDKLRLEMDAIRREVGTYSMMVVRSIFPPEDSILTGDLENVIAERLAAAPAAPGGGLWGALERTTTPRPERPKNPFPDD